MPAAKQVAYANEMNADGTNIVVRDCEYCWVYGHEDIPVLPEPGFTCHPGPCPLDRIPSHFHDETPLLTVDIQVLLLKWTPPSRCRFLQPRHGERRCDCGPRQRLRCAGSDP